jgi:ankyrin repeat protein
VLLEHGADIGAKDDKGRTPFQVAEEGKGDKIMELLSEHITK